MKERNSEVSGRLQLSFPCPPMDKPQAHSSPRETFQAARSLGTDCSAFPTPCSHGCQKHPTPRGAPCDGERPAARLSSPGRNPRPYPRRVNTKGGTTRPRGRTKACSATDDSGPPPPAAEAKGHRPRALEPLAPMSGPPAHGESLGRFALTGPWAPPCPARASARRCRRRRCRRRLLQAPLSPRKPHFRFRTLRTLPSLIGCFSRRFAGRDQ